MSLLAAAASARRRPATYALALLPQQPGWKYLQTTLADGTSYAAASFDDSGWLEGAAPFGNLSLNPGVGTSAHSYDSRFAATIATGTNFDQRLWIRRVWTLPGVASGGYNFTGFIDNSCVLYINGVQVFSVVGTSGPVTATIPASAFVAGANTIAMRCDDDATRGANDAVYFDFMLIPA